MPELGERIFVKPAAGLRVQRGDRMHGQFLPADGVEVVWDEFLAKRLDAGEVTLPRGHHDAARRALCGPDADPRDRADVGEAEARKAE